MNKFINEENNAINFGNDWGFYVDIEKSYSPNNDELIREKYNNSHNQNYLKNFDKIDEEIEYYEYQYNKKIQEKENIIKKNSSSLLFHISSLTLFTAVISYCFL
jgi:hypothetical protein